MTTTTITLLTCNECGVGNYRESESVGSTFNPLPEFVCDNVECRGEGIDLADVSLEDGEIVRVEDGLLGYVTLADDEIVFAVTDDDRAHSTVRHSRHPFDPDAGLSWHDMADHTCGEASAVETYVELKNTFDGWLEDDEMARSNYVRILEDWSDYVLPVSYANGYGLAIRVGTIVPAMLRQVVDGLYDYPVYDESDYSAREWEGFTSTVREALEWAGRGLDVEDDELEAAIVRAGEAYMELGNACRSDDVDWSELERMLKAELSIGE